jgi:glucose/arabinose dehydrogenase/PKD repeat protein
MSEPRGRRRLCLLLVALLTGALFSLHEDASAATVPAGFSDEHVTTVPRPVALDTTPDGRMVIATHDGQLYVFNNGVLLSPPALDITAEMCLDTEWGLNGLAVDPAFASNHFIYIHYTHKRYGSCARDTSTSPVNRVSRFVLGDDNHVDPLSEVPIVDGIPDPDGIHAGGDLTFGKDGYLYISTGDGGCDFRGDSGCYALNDAARDLGALSGKILRVVKDGSIPADNPYQGVDTARCSPGGFTDVTKKCQEIYAWGLRNPFRTAFDPNAAQTSFYINDVGLDKWEEIDVGTVGADYGWNVREGPCHRDSYSNCDAPPTGMTNPIFAYPHTTGCVSITAGDFVPDDGWPAQYEDKYLFGDLVCGKLWTLDPNGSGGYTATEFATGITNLIDGVFLPDGNSRSFYYITWGQFPNDQIRKISFTDNAAPTANAVADRTFGGVPLDVTFDGTGSTDPEGQVLSYEWDFGDGSAIATNATASHTYTTAGTYTATLTVRDGHGGEDQATIRIDVGNTPPQPVIQTPAAGERFAVGQTITLTGSATDPEDGALPDSSLSWRVERHHATHTHPWLPPTTGNGVQTQGPAPEDLSSTTNSYLDIYLTATDSRGRSATVHRTMDPRLVSLAFDSYPTAFDLEIAGSTVTTPATITSWEGWNVGVTAPAQAQNGSYWYFSWWSDGGGATHTIHTPASQASYWAGFSKANYPRPGGASPLRVPLVPAYARCSQPTDVHVPPLGERSCAPPNLSSPLLTTSTVGRGSGFVRLVVVPGDTATVADEADVRISVYASDVEQNVSGTPDFSGDLLFDMLLRVTDSSNGPSSLAPGTVEDAHFAVPVTCVPQPGLQGSTCGLTTTADAVAPGFALEKRRSVMSVPSIRLLDSGPDGELDTSPPAEADCLPACGTGDELPFLDQGLFTP